MLFWHLDFLYHRQCLTVLDLLSERSARQGTALYKSAALKLVEDRAAGDYIALPTGFLDIERPHYNLTRPVMVEILRPYLRGLVLHRSSAAAMGARLLQFKHRLQLTFVLQQEKKITGRARRGCAKQNRPEIEMN